jgi:hypothetical protein
MPSFRRKRRSTALNDLTTAWVDLTEKRPVEEGAQSHLSKTIT